MNVELIFLIPEGDASDSVDSGGLPTANHQDQFLVRQSLHHQRN